MAPELKSVAQRIYDDLAPLAYDDANQLYALANFVAAMSEQIQVVEDYARDTTDGLPGWSAILDADRAPAAVLGYLGQFVGVPLKAGLSEAAQRARVKAVGGWNRGTPAAIIAAAQQYLTGVKTVILRERDPAACALQPAYGLTVITYTAQTPNSAAVLAALLEQKPAGIVLNYQVKPGQDYQSLMTNHPTYSNIYSSYLTYQGIVVDQPGA
jgi:hypothetical protein